ncbi:MAG: beta-galactosidase [Phycisphaerae bacterium]
MYKIVFGFILVLTSFFTLHALAAGPTSAPATGLNDPSRIPIGVWLQDPRNAPKFKALGINCYVGLWQGPTAAQLAALEKAGMPVFCAQNDEARKPRWKQEILGWLQDDEPDNAQELPSGKGYGPPILPEKLLERYNAMKAADPTRPVMLNLGQGVAWDGWYGRGVRTNKPEDYPQYAKAGDIVSFDIYPVVHDRKEIAGKLDYVGRGVQRLVTWTQGKKPVWFCIECTHIGNAKVKATPEQVRSEVWMALIHGARGIIYFVHQFKPTFIEAALLQDEPMDQALTQINTQVQELAPVLHSPAPEQNATWDVAGQNPTAIAALTRRQGNATYVFAVGMTDQTIHVTFHHADGKGSIDVLGEQRQITASKGQWTDTFTGYQVHLYRLGAAPTP